MIHCTNPANIREGDLILTYYVLSVTTERVVYVVMDVRRIEHVGYDSDMREWYWEAQPLYKTWVYFNTGTCFSLIGRHSSMVYPRPEEPVLLVRGRPLQSPQRIRSFFKEVFWSLRDDLILKAHDCITRENFEDEDGVDDGGVVTRCL